MVCPSSRREGKKNNTGNDVNDVNEDENEDEQYSSPILSRDPDGLWWDWDLPPSAQPVRGWKKRPRRSLRMLCGLLWPLWVTGEGRWDGGGREMDGGG